MPVQNGFRMHICSQQICVQMRVQQILCIHTRLEQVYMCICIIWTYIWTCTFSIKARWREEWYIKEDIIAATTPLSYVCQVISEAVLDQWWLQAAAAAPCSQQAPCQAPVTITIKSSHLLCTLGQPCNQVQSNRHQCNQTDIKCNQTGIKCKIHAIKQTFAMKLDLCIDVELIRSCQICAIRIADTRKTKGTERER